MPHIPRGFIAGRVRLPLEVELSTSPWCPGWKAYSKKMSTRGGSLFRKSKGFHSIVLLALVDGDSRCLWVDIGAVGSTSDAQIFKHTDLRHKIEDGSISSPDSESLGIGGPKVNFFLLGMDFKEMVFNYRIRQGRTVVENASGILTSRFRIFWSPLQQEPPVVNRVVMACLVRHNLLSIRYPTAQQEDFGGGRARVR